MALPGAYRPTQSVDVGDAIPFHVAVTDEPATTLPGLSLSVGALLTVNALLDVSRVKPLFDNKRNS